MKLIHTIICCIIIAGYFTNAFASEPQSGERLWDLAAQNEILFDAIQSKVCNLALANPDAIFSAIAELEQTTMENDSQIDLIASNLDDLIGTQTALNASLQKTCIIEQQMQSATDNIIAAKDGIGDFITDADVGLTGTTIGLPGKYILCEVIDTTASTAITIDADNVELDLNGFSIINAGTAININSGHSNITIRNGLIKDTTGNGIDIDTASCIFIANIWVENSGDEGIYAEFSSNVIIKNVQLTGASSDGLCFFTCDNVIVQDALCSNNSASGLNFDSSSRITIKNCLCPNNGDQGIHMEICNTFEIHNCLCPNNTVNGILIFTSDNGLVKDNVCNSNTLEGIALTTNCSQIKVIGNICIGNGTNGIELDTATNCYVFENIGLLNTTSGANFVESAGGPNTFLSNWALEPEGGINQNYISTTSTINQVTIDQGGTFPSEPTKWQNIDMKT